MLLEVFIITLLILIVTKVTRDKETNLAVVFSLLFL